MAIDALEKRIVADKSIIVDFIAYQREWLKSHHDIVLDAETEKLVEEFLIDTGKAFIDEYDVPDNNVGDMISRQAAIDALAKVCIYYDSNGQYDEGTGAGRAKEVIEGLPSAEPEIIRCKDCKRNYSTVHNPMCDFMDAQLYPDSFCCYAERTTDE